MIRRLRGPAFLLLVGVNALLAQADILGWGRSWPFYLILAGVFALAERAALAAEGGYPTPPYPGAPYPGAPYTGVADPAAAPGAQPYPGQPATAIVPAHSQEYEKEPNGGQS
jgi:hypothetical protein